MTGGIVGSNSGTVSNCHVLNGIVDNGGVIISTAGVIGLIGSPSAITENNSFSKSSTGQEWGIGYDPLQTPPGPSNRGINALP